MAKDYQQQWEGVTNDADEAGAIRVMGEILATKDGRVFISRLGREEAELSIRILDNVSYDLHLPPPPIPTSDGSSGDHETQPRIYHEERFLCCVEEAC